MSKISNISYIKFLKNSGIKSFLQDKPNNFYTRDIKIEKKPTLIEEVTNIDKLSQFIKNSNICDLKKNANKTVIGDGNLQANIMLVGEAPGAEEDKIGKPFVGAAGKLLDKMLAAINIKRETIYITNIIPWRPPNNRTPTTEEIMQCLPFVQKHIEIIKPKIIVLLGTTAIKAILNTTNSISKLRGNWHEYKSINLDNTVLCLATYHPAFLLRSPNYKKYSWEDLKMLQQKINNEKF